MPIQRTSQPDVKYNCVAWILRDEDQWWWPSEYYRWPIEGGDDSINSFREAFEVLGYTQVIDERINDGFEKIAIYATHGRVTHVARQITSGQEKGKWTSKLGKGEDVTHDSLEDLKHHYGEVVLMMEKMSSAGD